MEQVLTKSFGFFVIIFLGYVLKNRGFLQKENGRFLSKIIINITLPSALVSSITEFDFSLIAIYMILIAFTLNFVVGLSVKWLYRHESGLVRATAMLNSTGYNIGNLTIPIAVSFYSGAPISYVSMFDVGNALSWMGGIYTLGYNEAKGENRKIQMKFVLRSLMRTAPFVTYVVLIIINLLGLSIPSPIFQTVEVIGRSNTFLVMLLIGMGIEFQVKKEELVQVIKILIIRLTVFVLASLLIYYVMPMPLLAKKIAMLCLASSIPSSALVFSRQYGDESAVPALVNSLAIIIGIMIASAVLIII